MKHLKLLFFFVILFSFVSCRKNACDGKVHEHFSAQLSEEFPGFIPYKPGDTLVLQKLNGIRSTFVCDTRSFRTDTYNHDVYDSNSNICFVDRYIQDNLTIVLRDVSNHNDYIRLVAYTNYDRAGLVENTLQYVCWNGIDSSVQFYYFAEPCYNSNNLSCFRYFNCKWNALQKCPSVWNKTGSGQISIYLL